MESLNFAEKWKEEKIFFQHISEWIGKEHVYSLFRLYNMKKSKFFLLQCPLTAPLKTCQFTEIPLETRIQTKGFEPRAIIGAYDKYIVLRGNYWIPVLFSPQRGNVYALVRFSIQHEEVQLVPLLVPARPEDLINGAWGEWDAVAMTPDGRTLRLHYLKRLLGGRWVLDVHAPPTIGLKIPQNHSRYFFPQNVGPKPWAFDVFKAATVEEAMELALRWLTEKPGLYPDYDERLVGIQFTPHDLSLWEFSGTASQLVRVGGYEEISMVLQKVIPCTAFEFRPVSLRRKSFLIAVSCEKGAQNTLSFDYLVLLSIGNQNGVGT